MPRSGFGLNELLGRNSAFLLASLQIGGRCGNVCCGCCNLCEIPWGRIFLSNLFGGVNCGIRLIKLPLECIKSHAAFLSHHRGCAARKERRCNGNCYDSLHAP
jgi:hypothetical protein